YLSVDSLGASSGNYQEYGRVLLPAFLTQYFGGYTKVRGVLEYLSTHSPQSSSPTLLYDAISSVVQSSGYDFYSFFVEWAAANYTSKAKYSIDFTLSPYSSSTSLNGLSGQLLLKYKNTGNSISYNMNLDSSASFYIFSLQSNTNSYSRACIMPVNTNTSGSLEYWYGATLQ
ncbi:MAG: hypothetical protein PUC73_09160, partial [Lachnospiraceae bacterium]|nr:hypothetical protein [Lachnospiraceae bacterium]